MSVTPIDFAVLGASPQARLIAGLLASRHGKSVLYQGESQSAYRLARGVDLSVAPITRPETWSLLQAVMPETSKLIASIGGRGSFSRIDPIFFSGTQAGTDALGHVRHMAQAFKQPAERAPAGLLEPSYQGVLLRDAILLHRAALEPALDSWLQSLGVRRLAMEHPLSLRPNGSAEVLLGNRSLEIKQTVLADDTAIITHLPDELWPASLLQQTASTLLTEPAKPLAMSLMYHVDTGIMLTQHMRGGIAALGPGIIEKFSEAVRGLLGPGRSMRQAGQSSYQRIVPVDGAPAAGRACGTGPDLIAGFGTTGAFFAPVIARWLAGVATPAENAWFAARLVDRDATMSFVSDIGDAP